MLYFLMDSIVSILIIFLLFANFIVVIILLKRKQPEQNNTEQILKDICDYLDIEFLKDRMLEGPKYNFVYPQDSVVKKES